MQRAARCGVPLVHWRESPRFNLRHGCGARAPARAAATMDDVLSTPTLTAASVAEARLEGYIAVRQGKPTRKSNWSEEHDDDAPLTTEQCVYRYTPAAVAALERVEAVMAAAWVGSRCCRPRASRSSAAATAVGRVLHGLRRLCLAPLLLLCCVASPRKARETCEAVRSGRAGPLSVEDVREGWEAGERVPVLRAAARRRDAAERRSADPLPVDGKVVWVKVPDLKLRGSSEAGVPVPRVAVHIYCAKPLWVPSSRRDAARMVQRQLRRAREAARGGVALHGVADRGRAPRPAARRSGGAGKRGASQSPTRSASPQPREDPPGTVLHFHGGGYVAGSAAGSRTALRRWARRLQGAPVLSVDYSLAPEQPYPTALLQGLAVYRWLRSGRGFRDAGVPLPRRVVLTGESAGANLAAAVAVRLLRQNMGRLVSGIDRRLVLSPAQPRTPSTGTGAAGGSLGAAGGYDDHMPPENAPPDAVVLVYPALFLHPLSAQLVSRSRAMLANDPILPASFRAVCNRAYAAPTHRPGGGGGGPDQEAIDDFRSPGFVATSDSEGEGGDERVQFGIDPLDPCLSPLLATDELLATMPPVYQIVGDADPLVDDATFFAARIRAARRAARLPTTGVGETRVLAGLPHGFVSMHYAGLLPDAADAVACVREWLAQSLGLHSAVPPRTPEPKPTRGTDGSDDDESSDERRSRPRLSSRGSDEGQVSSGGEDGAATTTTKTTTAADGDGNPNGRHPAARRSARRRITLSTDVAAARNASPRRSARRARPQSSTSRDDHAVPTAGRTERRSSRARPPRASGSTRSLRPRSRR